MRQRTRRRLPIHVRLLTLALGVVVVAAIAAVLVVQHFVREEALREAREKARILLDRNLATHHYFTEVLKPRVFEVVGPHVTAEYFDPVWMSSTYAVRAIETRFRALAAREYGYKEAAIDARTPANEADVFERRFIAALNADPTVVEQTAVRTIDGEPFLVVMRRGESMSASCLRCHTTPDAAPADLVRRFGAERSFGRSEGETVSAISIRVPLEAAYAESATLTWTLAALFVVLLLGIAIGFYAVSRRFFLRPLTAIRAQAEAIAGDVERVGAQIPARYGPEWGSLVDAFNAMSANLRASHDHLEARVEERTRALQEALVEVRTLSGIVPICAWCKKVRDDAGYWEQVEAYVSRHTDARFTHGVCPACEADLHAEHDAEDGGVT